MLEDLRIIQVLQFTSDDVQEMNRLLQDPDHWKLISTASGVDNTGYPVLWYSVAQVQTVVEAAQKQLRERTDVMP